MRSFFVDHQGQRELVVIASGSRYTVDFGKTAQYMAQQLKENVGVDEICPVIRER